MCRLYHVTCIVSVSTSLLVILGFSQAEDLAHTEDPLFALAASVPGVPGEDYPILSSPPDTSFVCDGYVSGYYADTEARCQAFHVCADGGRVGQIKYTFLCPNGTLFNQNYFTCDWWFNVDCSQVQPFPACDLVSQGKVSETVRIPPSNCPSKCEMSRLEPYSIVGRLSEEVL